MERFQLGALGNVNKGGTGDVWKLVDVQYFQMLLESVNITETGVGNAFAVGDVQLFDFLTAAGKGVEGRVGDLTAAQVDFAKKRASLRHELDRFISYLHARIQNQFLN